MDSLKNIWVELASKYSGNSKLIIQLWEEIAVSYSSEGRYYHNLNHLTFMLGELIGCKAHIQDFDSISFSVFYHDMIYDPLKKDNEEKSAEKALWCLKKLDVPGGIIKKCELQIMATKAHNLTEDTDINFLVDADLSILGEPPQVYELYTSNIRKEYAMFNNSVYREGRIKVLQHFLGMDKIYKTQYFYESQEQQARNNLNRELNKLD